jgi:predicted nucleic acid-binding protein
LYLLDTNVISAATPTKARPEAGLADWMDRNSPFLYLSVITIAELEDGIAKSRREGATRKADRIAQWLETVLHLYTGRVLTLDVPIALMVGRLSDQARSVGHSPGFADLAIAATALFHGHIVLTRNLRHFRMLGVHADDPFTHVPPG